MEEIQDNAPMAPEDKELQEQLLEAGRELENPPASVDDLLRILDRVENFLSRVEQSPSASMQSALSPSLKALIGDKLLRHDNVDVKVAVASCISEITRITAPEAPYDDDQMKEVFRVIVSSFENLNDETSRSYMKRTSILDTVAKVRSCVVMLDLECDDLILEMFQHFFKSIRDHHPESVFSSVETIMVLVLEESEDISLDLLSPILTSVKNGNKEFLPIARRLGERILERCATRLKPYLKQAVNTLGISLDEYSNVLASICQDLPGSMGQNDSCATSDHVEEESKLVHEPVEESAQVVRENSELATPAQQDNPVGDRSPKSVMSNGIAQAGEDDTLVDSKSLKKQDDALVESNSPKKQDDALVESNSPKKQDDALVDSKSLKKQDDVLVDSKSLEKQDDVDCAVQSKAISLAGNEEPKDLDAEKVDNSEQKSEQPTKKRGKKSSPSTSAEPSEKEAQKIVDSKSLNKEVPSSSHEDECVEATEPLENEKETNAKISSLKAGDGESDAVASPTPSENVNDENHSKKHGQARKKDTSAKEVATENVSNRVSEGTSDSEAKPLRAPAKKGLGRTSAKEAATEKVSNRVLEENSDSEAKSLRPSAKKGLGRTSAKEVAAENVSNRVLEGTSDSEAKPLRPSAKKGLSRTSTKVVSAENVSNRVSEGTSDSEAKPLRPSAKKGLGRTSAKEVGAENVSNRVSEESSDSEAKPLRPSAKKGLGRTSTVKKATAADAAKKGSRTTSDIDGRKSSAKKAEERNKGGGGSSSKQSEDKKKKGQGKGNPERGLVKSSAKDEDKEMMSSPKSGVKSTKDSHTEETSKSNLKRKRTPAKENESNAKKYDDLVGTRVKVWWPDDAMFYEGVVDYYDPATKKHKVLYDDGDEEILLLKEEKWEIIETGGASDVGEGSDHTTPGGSTDLPPKKKGKTSVDELKKEGKRDSSKSGGATSSKSKGASAKSSHKSKDSSKADRKSKDSKIAVKSEDEASRKSKDHSLKSGGSKSIDAPQRSKSKNPDGSKISKAKDTDGSKISKAKDDVSTPKTFAKSKQETPKAGKSKQETSKTISSSKAKSTKSGVKSNTNGSGKMKSNLLKAKDSENENSDDSMEVVEELKVKSSSKAGSGTKSGKKRGRN